MTQVTDEDRWAAADYLLEHEGYNATLHSRSCAEAVRSGTSHRMELAEAFARHREAAFNAGLERAADIVETIRPRPVAYDAVAQVIRAAKEPSNG